ncbi:hypothetical protein QBZ16_003470 [Prototheca wickerhamii]|uniref:Uncharacterized protein n=1 Tax=Prototheca wickerhamii TaxID=3111 RepID=A0AAD9MKT2_PROWI|nr:hypothetical protein QBZ16_003470 [Prototheca wickerhamii]
MQDLRFELAPSGRGAERAVCLASLAVAAFPAPHAGLLARPLGGKPGHQQPILAPPPKPVSPHFSAPPSDVIAVSHPVCTDDAAIGTCAVPRPSAARSAAQFLAGGVAGAVTKTLVAPLERVCCMLMAPAEGAAPGMLAALRTAWLEGGVPALFRGHGATLLKIVPASAVQFAVYHGVKDLLLHRRRDGRARAGLAAAQGAQLTDLERLLAGALAGAAATVATYPLESTRSVMSVAGGVPGGLLEAAVSVLRAQGPAGLYRGFGPTLVSDAFGSAVGFTLYEAYTRAYERATGKKAGPALRAVMGAASAATVMTFTMPLEVVRRRLQVQAAGPATPHFVSLRHFDGRGQWELLVRLCDRRNHRKPRTAAGGSSFSSASGGDAKSESDLKIANEGEGGKASGSTTSTSEGAATVTQAAGGSYVSKGRDPIVNVVSQGQALKPTKITSKSEFNATASP